MSSVKVTRAKDRRAVLNDARGLSFRVNEGAAKAGAEMARAMCPVSNDNSAGHVHLKDTIHVEANEQTGEATMIAGDPEQGVDYAEPVEFGHPTRSGSWVSGHFYFAHGIEAAKGEAQRLVEPLKPKE